MPVPAPPQSARSRAAPDRCGFEHKIFTQLGSVLFRPAETDGTPALVIPFGRGVAVLPLRSLQAELGIQNDSSDGRMLALVARSLDFVADMRPGDPLPFEVLDGAASWQPSTLHQRLAASRVRLQLIAELSVDAPTLWSRAEPQAVLAAAAAPMVRPRLQMAYIEVAAALGLPDAAAVTRLSDQAAHELAYVEALRDRLLRRVLRLMERVRHLSTGVGHNLSGLELLSRVQRLTDIALGRLEARFAELDALTEFVLDLLRELDIRQLSIRRHRDWLYSSLRAWEPILAAWEAAGVDWSEGTWPLLGRTYRFLAPRFMPVQEWQSSTRPSSDDGSLGRRMVW